MHLNILTKLLLTLCLFLVSCHGGNEESNHKLNTGNLEYKPSELSKLMLAMYDESEQIKQQIKNGEPLSFKLDYKRILTAKATDEDKTHSPNYQAMAKLYLHQIDSLKNSDQVQASKSYEKMVMSCVACHQAMCPGPLSRIKKLEL